MVLGLLQQEASYGMVYLYVGIFMLLVTGFVATTLVLARLISPARRSSTKGQNYETGEVTVTDPWRPFPVRYYVFALLFVVFETAGLANPCAPSRSCHSPPFGHVRFSNPQILKSSNP